MRGVVHLVLNCLSYLALGPCPGLLGRDLLIIGLSVSLHVLKRLKQVSNLCSATCGPRLLRLTVKTLTLSLSDLSSLSRSACCLVFLLALLVGFDPLARFATLARREAAYRQSAVHTTLKHPPTAQVRTASRLWVAQQPLGEGSPGLRCLNSFLPASISELGGKVLPVEMPAVLG